MSVRTRLHPAHTVGLLAVALVLGACGVGPQESAKRIDPLDVPNGLLSSTPPQTVVNSEGPFRFFVYLLAASPNTGLVFQGRNALRQPRPQDVIDALLRGPFTEELGVGIRSAIPTNSSARVVSISGSTATIDLGGPIVTALTSINEQNIALAQLLYTVTSIQGCVLSSPTNGCIERVRFTVNDGALSVAKKDGSRTTEPLSRNDIFVPGQP